MSRTPVARILPSLLLIMFLGALDQTVLTSTLPAIVGDLGGIEHMPTVLTTYFAATTVMMPISGALGDRYGRRNVLLSGLVLFGLGALLCMLSPDLLWLLAGRTVQGLGGGTLMVGAQTVLGEIVSPRERGRYLGALGGVYAIAAVGGPLLGGLAVDFATWRWVFATEVLLALAACLVCRRTLRTLPVHGSAGSIDGLGAAGLGTAVFALVFGLGGLGSSDTSGAAVAVSCLVLACLGALLWIVSARRHPDPILPFRLFRDRAFTIPVAISFLIGAALFGTIGYLPAYLQIAAGATATGSGLIVTVMMAGMILGTMTSGALITRTGRYRIFPILGTGLATIGLLSLGLLQSPTTELWFLALTLGVTGLGIGLVMQVMTLVVQNTVAHGDLGRATSAVTFLRQIGAAVGLAVVGAVTTARFDAALPAEAAGRLHDAAGLSPESLAGLPAALRTTVAEAYGHALPPALVAGSALLLIAFLCALALPARTLRRDAHMG